ncbi:unnamed protein product, partial [Porites lobata]
MLESMKKLKDEKEEVTKSLRNFAETCTVYVIVAIALHSLVDDCSKDLQARILRKPFASTPDGPPAPFVLKAVCLTISPFISVYTDSGYCPSIGPKSSEPNLAD